MSAHHTTPTTLEPSGMIPEFNALGQHPTDILRYFETDVQPAFERLEGYHPEYYRRIFHRLPFVLEELQRQPREFVGHHRPTMNQRLLSLDFVEALVRRSRCSLLENSYTNFRKARLLAELGNNIVMTLNHTSILDTYLTYSALAKDFGLGIDFAFLSSQVFEYVRLTALMTNGGNKFKMFQPKHIKRMRGKGPSGKSVAATMTRQNIATLRSLKTYCQNGGKIIFMYPEIDRATVMGAPEVDYLKILPSMKPMHGDLYIMAANTSGRNPIFANLPGSTNEADTLLTRLNVGHGDTSVGVPIKLTSMVKALGRMDQTSFVGALLGKIPTDAPLQDTTLGLAILSLVANLSPQDKGIYDNREALTMATRLIELGNEEW